MTLIAGIDPGASGAIAVYNTETMRIVSMNDMPVWYMTVGKKKRKRVDSVALLELFEVLEIMGVEFVVMEAVGGRPRQSASAGFVFGYGVGLLFMACMYKKLMVETVPPGTWKKIMNVPGKSKGTDDDIMMRADEMFPHDRHLWRGQKGGKKVDRAEAAMMAKFGGDHILPTLGPYKPSDEEFNIAYRKADTGA